jgi:hypothetical protein
MSRGLQLLLALSVSRQLRRPSMKVHVLFDEGYQALTTPNSRISIVSFDLEFQQFTERMCILFKFLTEPIDRPVDVARISDDGKSLVFSLWPEVISFYNVDLALAVDLGY